MNFTQPSNKYLLNNCYVSDPEVSIVVPIVPNTIFPLSLTEQYKQLIFLALQKKKTT